MRTNGALLVLLAPLACGCGAKVLPATEPISTDPHVQIARIVEFLGTKGETRAEVIGKLRALFASVANAEAEIAEIEAISNHLEALGYGSDRVLIDPAQPDNSFILEKLNFMDPQCGDQMPPLGTTLMTDELTCIGEWVDSVAAGG